MPPQRPTHRSSSQRNSASSYTFLRMILNEKSSLPVGTDTHVSLRCSRSMRERSVHASSGYPDGSARYDGVQRGHWLKSTSPTGMEYQMSSGVISSVPRLASSERSSSSSLALAGEVDVPSTSDSSVSSSARDSTSCAQRRWEKQRGRRRAR